MINKKLCIYLFLSSLILILISIFFVKIKVSHTISGPCVDCHTMHNSQDSQSMSYCATWSEGPFRALTRGNCAICHSGSDAGSISNIPYVNFWNDPGYQFSTSDSDDVLAGGGFYWAGIGNCTSTTATGYVCLHDVDFFIDINRAGSGPYEPPGWNSTYDSRRTDVDWTSTQLTCAGKYGCHGDPSQTDAFAAISGAHHKNVLCNSTSCDGSTVAKSYRFLLGIKGTEDPDWEKSWSTSDHNGYYAIDVYGGSVGSVSFDNASINYLCGECHGNFHWETTNSTYASPWLRHPTDIDMNNETIKNKEYGNYPGPFNATLGANAYFPEVPVGNTDGAVKSQVLQGTGDAIVLCISCHRAHGSPYKDLLRWPYYTCTCGNSTNSTTQCGCFACHTTK